MSLENLTEFSLVTPTGEERPAVPVLCNITAEAIRMLTRQVPELGARRWCRIYWSESHTVILLETFDEKVPNAFKIRRTRYEITIQCPKFIAKQPVKGSWAVEESEVDGRRFYRLSAEDKVTPEAPRRPRKRAKAPAPTGEAPRRPGRPRKVRTVEGAAEPKRKRVIHDAPPAPFRPSEALGRMFSEECDHTGKPCPGIGRCKCKCDPCLDVAVNS